MLPLLHSIGLALALLLTYILVLAIYRLFLHPLRHFPGPKLAALTSWYETYYDVYPHVGQFTLRVADMHKRYNSPIVRIGPNAVNVHDVDFWDTVYAPANHRRDRRKCFGWSSGGSSLSTFSTVSHDLHRRRRGALNPYFSKAAIRGLEGVVGEKVKKLCQRLKAKVGVEGAEGVVRMDAAYAALTTDVITQYSYGKDWGFLDKEDFDLAWRHGLRGIWVNFLVFQNFEWWSRLASKLPPKLMVDMDPNLAGYVRLMEDVDKQVVEVMKAEKGEQAGRKTIFHEMRDSDLPAEEKTKARLIEEGMLVVAAGTETTARSLYLLTFYLLSNPAVLQKLRKELRTDLKTESPTLADLESLPYLTAVVWEGLRMHGSVALPNSRIAPDEPMQYGKWTIPPGTEVSEISTLLVFDENIFPEPKKFRPERWVGPDAKTKINKLSKLVFGSGPRLCLGLNLAIAEVYFTVFNVFSKFDLELAGTTAEDVAIAHYSIGPVLPAGSRGVLVRVKGLLEK